jgi:hypothetical protein
MGRIKQDGREREKEAVEPPMEKAARKSDVNAIR